jgi:PhzF family phenazine biosynthesis protein
VTARPGGGEFDFVSRFFAPGSGIDEDPVTGSAHCALGPYWSQRLGKSEFTAFQASARGGVVRVTVKGGRVLLGGQAVTVMTGELLA